MKLSISTLSQNSIIKKLWDFQPLGWRVPWGPPSASLDWLSLCRHGSTPPLNSFHNPVGIIPTGWVVIWGLPDAFFVGCSSVHCHCVSAPWNSNFFLCACLITVGVIPWGWHHSCHVSTCEWWHMSPRKGPFRCPKMFNFLATCPCWCHPLVSSRPINFCHLSSGRREKGSLEALFCDQPLL